MTAMAEIRVPSWLRRALEAIVVTTAIAAVSLVGGRVSTAQVVALPAGAAGFLLLAPAVLALGVLPAAWPAAMAATRSDALFGAIAALLLAADATIMLASGPVALAARDQTLPAGLLAVLLAGGPGLAAIGAGQLASPLGFGRRAGAWSAAVGAVAGTAILAALALLG